MSINVRRRLEARWAAVHRAGGGIGGCDAGIAEDDVARCSAMSTGKSVLIAISVVLFVGAAWIILGWHLPWRVVRGDGAPGQWGDQFGAVTSLFSGLAMLGAILAVILQIREHAAEADYRRGSSSDAARQIELQALAARISAYSFLVSSNEKKLSELSRLQNEGATISPGHIEVADMARTAHLRSLLASLERLNELQPLNREGENPLGLP